MKRNFESWLLTMKDSIATWNYYTDFPKVYENVNKLKVELNILNSLIGSKNIEDEFKALLSRYPEIIKAIPILLAKREKEIPYSPIFVIMKLNEVWFRTLLNIQDTKLNLKILVSK